MPTRRFAAKKVYPDIQYATTNHAQRASGSCAKIEYPAAIERATIIYHNDDAAARLGISHPDARRQGFMSCCKSAAPTGIICGPSRRMPVPPKRGREPRQSEQLRLQSHKGAYETDKQLKQN
jgi:hypothetical protein